MNTINSDRMTKVISVILAVVFGVLLISLVVNAASTISTNIETGGTLSVTGASTLTGLTSMIQASSTRFSVHDTAYFGGSATSTFDSAGNLTVIGTLGVTGKTTLANASSTITSQTGNFMVNGFATTTASDGNIATAGTLTAVGASTLTGDVTMSGGNGALTITSANNATSTIAVGCITMYATSTVTAIHLAFATAQMATTTTHLGTGDTDGTYGGDVIWRYGACPF